jgi:hypothetical protein
VTAAELTLAETFNSGFVIRFPRVRRIRYDKEWTEAETLDSLKARHAEGKVFRQMEGGGGGGDGGVKTGKNGRKKKAGGTKRRGVGGVVSNRSLKMAKSKGATSEALNATNFYVFSRDMRFLKEMNRAVHDHGGILQANPIHKGRNQTDFALTNTNHGLQYKNLASFDKIDILTKQWLEECIKEGELIEYATNDRYYFHLCEQTRLENLEEEDPYGDSFSQPLSDVNELSTKLDQASKMLGTSDNQVSSSIMCGNDRSYFLNVMGNPNGLYSTVRDQMEVDEYEELIKSTTNPFHRVHVYCPNSRGELCVRLHEILLYGGEQVLQLKDSTHVLVDVEDGATIQKIRNDMKVLRSGATASAPMKEIRLVTSTWVVDCIAQNLYITPEENNGVHSPLPETKFVH